MVPRLTRWGVFVVVFCTYSVAASAQQREFHWFKGNTHTHTLNSDGDSMPDEVVRWYAERGYDFLVLTDHAVVDNVDPLNALFNADGQFLVIRGEEVTSNFDNRSVHVNALNPQHAVEAQRGTDARDTLQKNLDVVHSVAPLAQINHPNWRWQLTAKDIASAKGGDLLEIYNGHPGSNNLGAGPEFPGTEQLWDEVLSQGVRIWGVASDDTHVLKQPWATGEPLPGRGWIVVRAEHLATEEVIHAIQNGNFYASTGVELKDIQANDKQLAIVVRARGAAKYRVQFIGKNGRILQETATNSATYAFQADEGYVRAKVIDSDGKMAWTQPVFLPAQSTH